MADVTLSDGTEITFDLNKITRFDVRALLDDDQSDDEANQILSRTCELSEKQINDLGYIDWRKFLKAFWQKVREPLSDPNTSRSEPS